MLWLDPTFGVAGDMLLGALVGLGADLDRMVDGIGALGIAGWRIVRSNVTRNSLSATRTAVEVEERHHHRTWSSIDVMLAEGGLPDPVKTGARATFRRLGEVEAQMHGVDIDEVHFHEVGAVDAIVDVVGGWIGLADLGIDEVVSGPVGLGSGTVVAAHGRLPLPAPATAELLAGSPIRSLDIEGETVTPTGAALLVTMTDRWGPMPSGILTSTSRGAGGRDPDGHPNVVTAHLVLSPGRTAASGWNPDRSSGELPPGPPGSQRVEAVMLETNLDDVSPEVVGHLITRCLVLGADDAWALPVVMKKSRPGVQFRVLCDAALAPELESAVFTETGTLGIRVLPVAKDMLERSTVQVSVRNHSIRIKIGPHRVKPEHDDLVAAARSLALPLRQLAREAIAELDAGRATK